MAVLSMSETGTLLIPQIDGYQTHSLAMIKGVKGFAAHSVCNTTEV